MMEKENKQYISDYAQLMSEWDYQKNAALMISPFSVSHMSHKKVWWKCTLGHSWLASIAKRATGQKCPICQGKKVEIGFNDLATTHPDLVREWDDEKNIDLQPTEVNRGSHKKVWWKCALGHSWLASIEKRVTGQKCPICQGKKVEIGFNDLATTHPDLVQEWDYEKNIDLQPTEVSMGSHKKAWWLCKHNHSWQADISSRVGGRTCPQCVTELQSSYPEKALYYYIKKIFSDTIASYKINGSKLFELDIFIPSLNIGIEYDGEKWHQDIERDIDKNKKCSALGITLFRVREPGCPTLSDNLSINIFMHSKRNDLHNAIYETITKIQNITNTKASIKIDLDSDNVEILNLLIPAEKENCLQELYPNIALEWDPSKNGNLTPRNVMAHSGKKVWWICPQGHSYSLSIAARTAGKGCSVCAGRMILKGVNDFASQYPELAKEWDYQKNTITPDMITSGSDKKFWFKCPLGHSYIQTINNRKAYQSCPICSGKKVLEGFNDIATTHPLLIAEWNYALNNVSPTEITAGSHKKVWWKCSICGNEWMTMVASRTRGHGCPKCSAAKASRKKTHENFIRQLSSVSPRIQPLDSYAGAKEKIKCRCLDCGYEWSASPNNLLQGHSCPTCRKNNKSLKHALHKYNQ